MTTPPADTSPDGDGDGDAASAYPPGRRLASGQDAARHQAPLKGILLAVLAMLVFAGQDAVTKVLTGSYPVAQILMVRYLAFFVFAMIWAARRGGLRRAMASRQRGWQILRSLLLVFEASLFAWLVHFLPLADMHALFAVAPLLVTALAVPVLGERVGWRRWVAVGIGFVGVLVILRPGSGLMHPVAPLALGAALMFSVYVVLTRKVSATDSAESSLLHMAAIGAAVTLLAGPWVWEPPDAAGWLMLLSVATTSILGHVLFVLALQAAPASILQPFQYTLLVWATVIGLLVFGDLPDAATVIGASIVVGSGLYVLWRERRTGRSAG